MKKEQCEVVNVYKRYKAKNQRYLFTYSTVAEKVSDKALPGDFDIRDLARKLGYEIDHTDSTCAHNVIIELAIKNNIPFHMQAVADSDEEW